MNTLTLGDLVEIRLWCNDSEQASVNRWWYAVAAVGATPATDQDVASQIDASLAPLFKAILNNNANYRGVQAQIHNSLAPFRAIHTAAFQNANAGPGTAGAAGLPRQTCGLGSFQTQFSGQANRGRIYYPFPAASDDTGDGKPTVGYVNQIVVITQDISVGTLIVAGSRNATLVRVLVHGKNKIGLQPGPTPVTGFSVSSFWATQRRRGSFGRANKSPI